VTVYVDDYRIPWRGRAWSHLTADTAEELHAFAARLGLGRRRFHHKPSRPWQDHYDVPEAKRRQAIHLGAKPIDSRQAAEMLRAKRLSLSEPTPSKVPCPR
jgi:Ser/Thr protein kinase RdoA (MazF antagonist)